MSYQGDRKYAYGIMGDPRMMKQPKIKTQKKVTITAWIPREMSVKIVEQDLGTIKEDLIDWGYDAVQVKIEE